MSDRITVIGNVASIPERRELPGGVPAISFRLASSERRLENGQWVDTHTNWYWVSAYRKLADHALASLEKGQRVIVSGRFRVKQWESGGKSGSSAEIDAEGLGHDLMFGTTTFQKSSQPASPAPAPDTAGWATPGVDDAGAHTEEGEAALSARPSSSDPRQSELVNAGANSLGGADWQPPGDDVTPF